LLLSLGPGSLVAEREELRTPPGKLEQVLRLPPSAYVRACRRVALRQAPLLPLFRVHASEQAGAAVAVARTASGNS